MYNKEQFYPYYCSSKSLPIEPVCVRKPTIWVLTRSDTNLALQSQKQARSLKFLKRKCTIPVMKTKALISLITTKLICVFVFAYADCLFTHAAAQLIITYTAKAFTCSLVVGRGCIFSVTSSINLSSVESHGGSYGRLSVLDWASASFWSWAWSSSSRCFSSRSCCLRVFLKKKNNSHNAMKLLFLNKKVFRYNKAFKSMHT